MLNLIIALIIGGIIGWLASIIMRRDAPAGHPAQVVVGIIGAVLGACLLGRVRRRHDPERDFSIRRCSPSSARDLLAIVNLFTRKRIR
jgi:uncharacterized membrane protein YeaQ/YmgE (transglycosylase-associated protein family)